MDERRQIRNIVKNKLKSLPTLPEVVTNIVALARDEKSRTTDLAGYIERDQSICAAVLRVANSAYYGYYRKVDTISRAIVILGFERIRTIALSTGIFARLTSTASQYLDWRQFWIHCIGVATAAKFISERRGQAEESFFTCGLMHDIGKLILDQHFPLDYTNAVTRAKAELTPIWEVENNIFGIDHAEVGQLILEHWKLPEHIVNGVRFHHDIRGYSMLPEVALVVTLADNLCIEMELGTSGAPKTGLNYLLGHYLGFSPSELRYLCQKLEGARESIEGFFNALL